MQKRGMVVISKYVKKVALWQALHALGLVQLIKKTLVVLQNLRLRLEKKLKLFSKGMLLLKAISFDFNLTLRIGPQNWQNFPNETLHTVNTLTVKYVKILRSKVFCQFKHKKLPLRADELENKICKRFILQWFFDATKLNMIYFLFYF